MYDKDPDEELSLPARELRVAISLADNLLAALNANQRLANELASILPPFDADARLPEVGEVEDGDALRLHLLRLAERLAPYVPGATADRRTIETAEEAIGEFKFRRITKAMAFEGDDYDLADFFVWWDEIMLDDVDSYKEVLKSATDEKPLQRYLANNPRMLVQHLHGGHGRWVVSQKRLGSEYVPDFLIAERSSSGIEWQFVELQSPRASLFVPSTGRNSAQLDEGLRQIEEWRRWLDDNRAYARNTKAHNGFGLRNISANYPGLLLIGRESGLDDVSRERRRQLGSRYSIAIHTYDWISRGAEAWLRTNRSAG